ncbi:MAG: fused MFS/spermidine synthase [Geminicoccaceae bacterium]|nr:fused MFS/spermidine synthase [Geminicoccaceae bacterium]
MKIFAVTLFTSAVAVFLIQPMFSRMVLPIYGGSPAVWTTAMLFFQTALLAGYLYAHLLAARWTLRRQLIVHSTVLLLGLLALPILPRPELNPFADTGWVPARLLGLMLVSVGLPFVIVSASAPFLQRWFSQTDDENAADPYFLYASSNAGSILALLGYPFIVEPLIGLRHQAVLWTVIYLALCALVVACGIQALRHERPAGQTAVSRHGMPDGAVGASGIVSWLLLAALPSGLLHATTLHITTDIVSAPMVWVIPLTLYLLTFIIAFARSPIFRADFVLRFLVPIPVMLAIVAFGLPLNWLFELVVALALLFVLALACHQRLASLRPDAQHLTLFYLVMATGGVAGGTFSTLIAPLIFSRQYELPLLIAASLCSLPAMSPSMDRRWWLYLAGGAILILLEPVLNRLDPDFSWLPLFLVLVPVFGTILKNAPRGLATIFMSSIFGLWWAGSPEVLLRERSFFGIYTVDQTSEKPGQIVNKLIHGTTMHGVEALDPALATTPLSYYHPDGPLGDVMRAMVKRTGHVERWVVGLGAGSVACYRFAPEAGPWTFVEIDPTVVSIARDSGYFSFLSRCAPDARIRIGDGRLELRQAQEGKIDLLILDAFTSDVIPLHLMTREAFGLYRSRLSDDGVLMVHISNRTINLRPAVSNIAASVGLVGSVLWDNTGGRDWLHSSSQWVVLARSRAVIDRLKLGKSWQPLDAAPGQRLWTDDYANIIPYLRWGKFPTFDTQRMFGRTEDNDSPG